MTTTAFESLTDRVRRHALAAPTKVALTDDEERLTYAELDRLIDQVAAALQRDGVLPGRTIALVAGPSIGQAALILGALRAGSAPALIQPSATGEQIAAMITDADARLVFIGSEEHVQHAAQSLGRTCIKIEQLKDWLGDVRAPAPVVVQPDDAFNIIYSSGTTGVPKGIVVSHGMRADQFASYRDMGYADSVTLIATPLYSSTTLVAFLPTLAYGGTVVLMRRFDALRYLDLAQKYRATHTMLVPLQYKRIMALSEFHLFDLSSFRWKFCTSSPFDPKLKKDVLQRWPGKLVEFYGMTEGGGSTVLWANEHPDKLHTVGVPAPGHELRVIDAQGLQLPAGETGEIVSRSGAMMSGYHGRADATAAATWTCPNGERFIRHGDIGRFDEDGFLILLDRSKDVIISGGFNIYPSDLEAVLAQHPDVAECAVVGTASERWGETPVGFYVARKGATTHAGDLLQWTNAQLGKTQRLAQLHTVDELPRSAIGKVLKRELRDRLASEVQ